MSFFRDIAASFGLVPVQMPEGMKAAYDLVPTGVQGRPQYPSTDVDSLLSVYSKSEIIYACINAKATAAKDPRLLVQRKTGREWSEVEGHPLRRLLMRPNPLMDEAGLCEAAIVSRDVAGVFYAEKVRAARNGPPVELWPLNPAKVAAIPRDDGNADYLYKDGTSKVTIRGEDMLVWRQYNIASRWQASSPLARCLGSVDADIAQTDYVRAFFNNAGVPSGILKVKGRAINQEQSDEIKAQWRAKYGRAWGQQHDVAVLDDNAEYQELGSKLDQLDNETLREVTESRICMTFGVPPLIVYAFAGLKRATYSNSDQAWESFWESTMGPWFKSWRSFLLWSLLPEFESEDLIYGERVRLWHDMSAVAALQEDETARQDRARENFRAGGITHNQFLAAIGEEPLPNGDYFLRPMSLIAVSVSDPMESATAAVPKSRPYPAAVKTLGAATRRRLGQRGERVVRQYFAGEYAKVIGAARAQV